MALFRARTIHLFGRFFLTLVGLALTAMALLILLLTGLMTYVGLADRRETHNLWWSVPGFVMALACVGWSTRVVFQRPRSDGGLLAPTWLVGLGGLLLAMPLVSLFTGAYRTIGLPTWLMVVLSILSVGGMWSLVDKAKSRKAAEHETNGEH